MGEMNASANLDGLLETHQAWWQKRGSLFGRVRQQPLGNLWLPLATGDTATTDLLLEPGMLDAERLSGPDLPEGALCRDGDLLRVSCPYSRIPWVEAVLGCQIRATILGGSMRSQPFLEDVKVWESIRGRTNQAWFALLLDQVDRLVAKSHGRRAVTQTLMRGPSDLVEAMLGAQETCLAMYDAPRALQGLLEHVSDVFVDLHRAQMGRIRRLCGGHVSWFGVWAPGTVVRTQCDASAFLSARQYERVFFAHDRRICASADYSIMHLHSGSLHTVDTMLSDSLPHAVQISVDPEPSGPPVLSLIPVFRRILECKPIIIDGVLSEAEVTRMQDVLPAAGLCIIAREEIREQD